MASDSSDAKDDTGSSTEAGAQLSSKIVAEAPNMLDQTSDQTSTMVWAITDGTPGMRYQALALAKAIQKARPQFTVCEYQAIPHRLIRSFARLGQQFSFLPLYANNNDANMPPNGEYPDILITCGRRMAGFGLAMRQRAKKAGVTTQLVHLQDPRLSPDLFDVLIVPKHDPARGKTVITTTGSLNRLTLESIRRSMMDLPSKWLVRDTKPTVVVMLGGDNRRYKITDEMTAAMATHLKTFATSEPMRLVLLPSRRTPPTLIPKLLADLEDGDDKIEVQTVSDDEPNPYPGILGVADTVIVTADSVNMACEAAIIGKPVLIARWKIGAAQDTGQNLLGETGRIAAFHQTMIAAGHTAPLGPNLPRAPFTALDEVSEVVERLLDMLNR